MLQRAKDQLMPRTATVPAVPVPTRAVMHDDYADEAARAARRYLDQVAQIEQLTAEVEQWRNRALLAEGEAKACGQRHGEQLAQSDQRTLLLQQELDGCRQTLAVIAAQYASASKILLDGIAAIDSLAGIKARIDTRQLALAMRQPPPPHEEREDPLSDSAIAQIASTFAAAKHDD